jgi:hypothetical protein
MHLLPMDVMADSSYFDLAHGQQDVLAVQWDQLDDDELWERLDRYKPDQRSPTTTPLFPPSPPGPGPRTRHPVQVLAYALRRTQEENASLQAELRRLRARGADEVRRPTPPAVHR